MRVLARANGKPSSLGQPVQVIYPSAIPTEFDLNPNATEEENYNLLLKYLTDLNRIVKTSGRQRFG